MEKITTIDFKGDGAFERAWMNVCKVHNEKHLFFRQCTKCAEDAQKKSIADLNHHVINASLNICALTTDKELLTEVSVIIKAVKDYTDLVNKK